MLKLILNEYKKPTKSPPPHTHTHPHPTYDMHTHTQPKKKKQKNQKKKVGSMLTSLMQKKEDGVKISDGCIDVHCKTFLEQFAFARKVPMLKAEGHVDWDPMANGTSTYTSRIPVGICQGTGAVDWDMVKSKMLFDGCRDMFAGNGTQISKAAVETYLETSGNKCLQKAMTLTISEQPALYNSIVDITMKLKDSKGNVDAAAKAMYDDVRRYI